MPTPLISVVMGVYNGGQELKPTIDSILSQTVEDFEFIIVDDGSTDESRDVLQRCASADTRIRPIMQANAGLTKSLIEGCRHARGNFIARQDVGDRSLPHRFRSQLDYFNVHKDVVAIGAGGRRIGPAGEHLGERVRKLSPAQVTSALLEEGIGLSHMVAMMRREAFERAGGYRPEFRFAQDTDLWHRMSQTGKLGEVDDVLFEWAIDVGGISSTSHDRQRQLAALARESYRVVESGGDDSDILRRAVEISWGDLPKSEQIPRNIALASAEYFIGSQLYTRRDRRCQAYLARAIRHRPLWIRSWIKLAFSLANTRNLEVAGEGMK